MADAIIDDPGGHFPYARDRAEHAGVPAEVAGWCERVVSAQEAYLRDPTAETAQALQDVMAAAQQFNQDRRRAIPPDPSVAHPDTVHAALRS